LKPFKTFWELISGEYPASVLPGERDEEFVIDIPIIQRDYAQGREREKQRRDLFLQELFNNINETKPLHLEFIYGRVDKQDGKSVFSPIDGQQRLTTLYLLHWYIGLKEKIKEKKPESFNKLKNFIYDTRISSRDFCKALIEKDIVLPGSEKESVIDIITKSYWFRESWNYDPTIKAMLIMIQAIHSMFFNTDGIWPKLTEKEIITFHILDMGEKNFELNDELYIKMNSRGKQLTPFEVFKANFIGFLETEYKDKYFYDSKYSYNDYFSFRIEKEWTDLFWAYKDEKVFVIDDYFMNYFEFISQLLYFLDHSGKNVRADEFDVNNFTQIKEIYSNEKSFIYNNNVNIDRVAFLFKSLNLFYNISLINNEVDKKSLNNFFKELFYSSDSENNNNMKIKVDNEDQIYLFERCLKDNLKDENNNFQNKDRIILFSIIAYCLKFNLTNFSNKDYLSIKHCVRVIRNLLQAQRQRKDISYEADLSINDFKNYWKLINELLEAEIYKILPAKIPDFSNKMTKQLKEEIKKAVLINSSENEIQRNEIQRVLFMLEDFDYFKGLIHVLNIDKNKDKLNEYLTAIREIWSNKDPLIIRAMIASGFIGYGKDCAHFKAKARYFGKKDNKKDNWYFILTNDIDNEIAKNIVSLLDNFIAIKDKLTTQEKMQKIISEARNNFTKNNWQYYFLEYTEILDNSEFYYFAFYNNDDFNVRIFTTDGISPLLALHINAYVSVICNNNEVKNYCKSEYDCSTVYDNTSPLILKNGLKLFCEKEGWRLDETEMNAGTNKNYQSVKKEYISGSDNILRDYKDLDRIQTVIKFIKEIYA